jgi:hypothetical protein
MEKNINNVDDRGNFEPPQRGSYCGIAADNIEINQRG